MKDEIRALINEIYELTHQINDGDKCRCHFDLSGPSDKYRCHFDLNGPSESIYVYVRPIKGNEWLYCSQPVFYTVRIYQTQEDVVNILNNVIENLKTFTGVKPC